MFGCIWCWMYIAANSKNVKTTKQNEKNNQKLIKNLKMNK